MPLSNLDQSEREVVRQCLCAAVNGPFFPEWEFHTLFGVERDQVESILESWPEVNETNEDVQLAINNLLGNLIGYPHGHEKDWPHFITVSSEAVERILRKWRQNV